MFKQGVDRALVTMQNVGPAVKCVYGRKRAVGGETRRDGSLSTKVLYSASLLEGASGGAPAAAVSVALTHSDTHTGPSCWNQTKIGKKEGARAMQRLAVS